jgi:poly(beta-D-mannuronate) lyase
MKSHILVKLFLFCYLLFVSNSFGQTVNNQSELNSAISNASAGSTIILANGTWNNLQLSINKNGTATNPITIKAQNPNQVFIEGKSNIQIGGSFLIFEGFVFQNASNLVVSSDKIDPLIEFRASNGNACNNCTVTNIKIDGYNGTSAQEEAVFKWILLYGSYNEISHSSFIGKNGVGSIINDNRSDNLADYHKIHHNYFASRTAVGDVNNLNDQDAIRIGTSTTSLSDSFTEIYDNFFYDWEGEIEIISNKSGKNKYYNNTFREYSGTLTLRHGNGCEVFNNYFLANKRIFSGGIRVIGEDHKIYNNYIEGVNAEKPDGSNTKTTGAINISNGRPNSALNGYYQVKNTVIVNNTFVNCDYGFRLGTQVKSDLTLAPENLTLANNIMLNTSENAFEIRTNAIGNSKYEGNITQNGSWNLTNGVDNNQTVTANLLESGSQFFRIPSASPAKEAAIGAYSFLTDDILGGTRNSTFDAGAEEFGANGVNLPYNVSDVGVKVGFLSTNVLSITQNTLFTKGIHIYPVPANDGFIKIKSEKSNIGFIEIFDIRGKQLLKKKITSQNGQVNIDSFSKGIYIIKIQGSFGRFIVN